MKYRLLACTLVAAFLILTCSGCSETASENGSHTDESRRIYFVSDDPVALSAGQSVTEGYVRVIASDKTVDWADRVSFVSDDPDVAAIEYSSTVNSFFLHYTITGISPGETDIFARYSYDGQESVTGKIHITVTPGDTTAPETARSEEVTTAETQYVLNKSSKKIHLPECTYARKIQEENKDTTTDLALAIANGYLPCKSCMKSRSDTVKAG